MRLWMIGGVAAAWAGLGVYVLLANKNAPAPAAPEVAATVAPPADPPPPVVLADVIELTDLDPLLDPPDRPAAGVPFDETPAVPADAAPDPAFIPPAADDSPAALAPMPREAVAVPVPYPSWGVSGIWFHY